MSATTAGVVVGRWGRLLATLCLLAVVSSQVVMSADGDAAAAAAAAAATVTTTEAGMNTAPRGLGEGLDLPHLTTHGLVGEEGGAKSHVTVEFKEFIKKHKKALKYCPGVSEDKPCIEALRRELSFLENKAIIEEHNARPDNTFTLGFTPFADYTGDEFVANNLKYKSQKSLREKRMEKRAKNAAVKKGDAVKLLAGMGGGVVNPSGHLGVAKNANLDSFPKNFNWADVPEVMGKIHMQETSCASCWAYTSTDTIEAQAVISGRRKKHVELSAEQLINCDGYDSGCNTGNMFTAYEWIHENGGLATARSFHTAAQQLAAARSAALTTAEPALAGAGAAFSGGFNPVVGTGAGAGATTSAVPVANVPLTAVLGGAGAATAADPAVESTPALGKSSKSSSSASSPRRNIVRKTAKTDKKEDAITGELSSVRSEDKLAAAMADIGAEYEEALGAEEEKQALDAIESGLGSASGDCPAQLPLMDRVYGYCELDFESGEAALMEAVAKHPVAIGINANKVFQLYASGIIRAADCGPAPHTQDSEIMSINHAVIVTGWGETHVNGKLIKYWVLKNSFGENWGEKGYFKLERGAQTLDGEGFGTCGMYFESVYPVMDEHATEASCVPGCTFRTKYYSAAAAVGAGAVLGVNQDTSSLEEASAASSSSSSIVFSVMGSHRGANEVAALLVGFGFVAGLTVAALWALVSRVRRVLSGGALASSAKQDEGASLLPQ